jgi:hypothetical protein
MKLWPSLVLLSGVMFFGGCATRPPSGPRVVVLPGTGKTYNEFSQNDKLCRQYAGRSIGIAADGSAVPESPRYSGEEAQYRYDEAYIQCMYAHGNKVPISEEVANTLRQKPMPTADDVSTKASSVVPAKVPAGTPTKATVSAPVKAPAKVSPSVPVKSGPDKNTVVAPAEKPRQDIPPPPPFAPPESPPPDYAPQR